MGQYDYSILVSVYMRVCVCVCVCVSRTILNSSISSWTLKGNGNIMNISLDYLQ